MRQIGIVSVLLGLQALAFISVYAIAVLSYSRYVHAIRPDIGYGVQLHYGIGLFALLALLNATCLIVRSGKDRLVGFFTASGGWVVYWGSLFGLMPFRFLAVVLSGLIGFSMAVAASRLMHRTNA